MKKFFSGLLAVVLCMSSLGGLAPVHAQDVEMAESNIIEGQYIIALNDGLAQNSEVEMALDGGAALEALGATVLDNLEESTQVDGMGTMAEEQAEPAWMADLGDIYLVEYQSENNEGAAELQAKLEEKGFDVRYIEPNQEVEAYEMDTVDAYAVNPQQTWHYNMVKAPQAWQTTIGSRNVSVAILDTGMDHNNPSISPFVDLSRAKSFVGGDTMDRQGHGTHVTGTIVSTGVVSGVMQEATVFPVKVLGDDGRGSTYGIQQGIIYATRANAWAINMSLGGGGYSQGMDEACAAAQQAGVVVVAAAGNSGTGSISYPARYESVIAVGALDANQGRAYYSQYGYGLEVMAPGSGIYSTYLNNSFRKLSGTSMATPHVVGVVGLIRSANPNLNAYQVREILRNTAVSIGNTNEYGYGLVDAEAAVLNALQY